MPEEKKVAKTPAGAVKIGTGKDKDGRAVAFWEADRPGTIGRYGGSGVLVLVCHPETHEKFTHSDSLEALRGAGFTVDEGATPQRQLRQDGPTLEAFLEAGYKAENYPPEGFAEKHSAALEAYRKKLSQQSHVGRR